MASYGLKAAQLTGSGDWVTLNYAIDLALEAIHLWDQGHSPGGRVRLKRRLTISVNTLDGPQASCFSHFQQADDLLVRLIVRWRGKTVADVPMLTATSGYRVLGPSHFDLGAWIFILAQYVLAARSRLSNSQQDLPDFIEENTDSAEGDDV